MLNTERNTSAMERRVLAAARARFRERKITAVFEHGQWWITRADGSQYSVVDTSGHFPCGFDFEQVTAPDE